MEYIFINFAPYARGPGKKSSTRSHFEKKISFLGTPKIFSIFIIFYTNITKFVVVFAVWRWMNNSFPDRACPLTIVILTLLNFYFFFKLNTLHNKIHFLLFFYFTFYLPTTQIEKISQNKTKKKYHFIFIEFSQILKFLYPPPPASCRRFLCFPASVPYVANFRN